MNLPAALTSLATAGITRRALAADLHVHRTTIARWTTGARPNPANLAALRTLVDDLLRTVHAEQSIANRDQADALCAARDVLLTDTERAGNDAVAARLFNTLVARLAAEARPVAVRVGDPFVLHAARRTDLIDAALAA